MQYLDPNSSNGCAAFVSAVMQLPVVLLDMRMSITSILVMVSHLIPQWLDHVCLRMRKASGLWSSLIIR